MPRYDVPDQVLFKKDKEQLERNKCCKCCDSATHKIDKKTFCFYHYKKYIMKCYLEYLLERFSDEFEDMLFQNNENKEIIEHECATERIIQDEY